MNHPSARSLLTGVLLAAACAGTALAGANPVREIDVRQAQALRSKGALLLDVREVGEHAQGHAPGSTLIPLGQLQQRLGEIEGDKHRPVAIICRSGNRSAKALKVLEDAGFTAAVNVQGGMLAWQKEGLPVVPGAPAR